MFSRMTLIGQMMESGTTIQILFKRKEEKKWVKNLPSTPLDSHTHAPVHTHQPQSNYDISAATPQNSGSNWAEDNQTSKRRREEMRFSFPGQL